MEIYTIGHSNHKWELFLELLKQNKIEMVVDVRAVPRSRFAPWANKALGETLGKRASSTAGWGTGWAGGPGFNERTRAKKSLKPTLLAGTRKNLINRDRCPAGRSRQTAHSHYVRCAIPHPLP